MSGILSHSERARMRALLLTSSAITLFSAPAIGQDASKSTQLPEVTVQQGAPVAPAKKAAKKSVPSPQTQPPVQTNTEKPVPLELPAGVTLAPDVAAQVTQTTAGPTLGYKAFTSFTGTKSDTPIQYTPMSVQVVPREVIDDQQSLTVKDAVKNVSGVYSSPSEFYDQYTIRGFDSGYGITYRNGLQLEGITKPVDSAFIERVEIVKGPASMLYGRIEPGGFVNIVTKRPEEEASVTVEQQIGSWDLFRTVVDATGPLSKDGTLLYRLTGVFDQSESWVDFDERRNKAISGTIRWQPTNDFKIDVDVEHYDYRMTSPGEATVPVVNGKPLNLPRNYTIGDPALWNDLPYDPERTLFGYNATLKLAEGWSLTSRFHYVTSTEHQPTIGNWPGFDGVSTQNRALWNIKFDRDEYASNLDLAGKVSLAGMEHRLLVGGDWFRYHADEIGFSGDTPLLPGLNVFNPVYGLDGRALRALPPNFFGEESREDYGIYFQDQIAVTDRLEFLIGGRYDWASVANTWTDDYHHPLPPAIREEAFSPRAGLLYKLTDDLSLFTSYSKSFGANNGQTASGAAIDPQEGKQYEFGAKAALLGGMMDVTGTWFHLTKSNLMTPDPNNPVASIPVGEVLSQGFELDVAGKLTRNVSVIASYAYTDAEITKDNSGNEGNVFNNVPEHGGSIWAKYDSAPGETSGWSAGLGAFLRSSRWGDDANTYELPGYVTVDAMLGYRFEVQNVPFELQVNGRNLLDETYWDYGAWGYATYGAPRSFIGSLSAKF